MTISGKSSVGDQTDVVKLWLTEDSPSFTLRKQIWCMREMCGETQNKIYIVNNNRRIYCVCEQKQKLQVFGIRGQKVAAFCKNSAVWERQVLEIEIVFSVVNLRETSHLKKRTESYLSWTFTFVSITSGKHREVTNERKTKMNSFSVLWCLWLPGGQYQTSGQVGGKSCNSLWR